MKYLKHFSISILITFISIIVFTFIITLFNYFNLFNIKITNILNICFICLSFIIGGFFLGKKVNKNGYLEGIKIGLIGIVILIIINLMFDKINYKDIIFYFIILISSIFGSIIGINKKSST